MIRVKIDEGELVDMLMSRVLFWTNDPLTLKLYFEMYENYVYSGMFDDMELDVEVIVDNDYVNYVDIITQEDEEYKHLLEIYKKQGIGDISCESKIYSFIEAYDNEAKAFLVRY